MARTLPALSRSTKRSASSVLATEVGARLAHHGQGGESEQREAAQELEAPVLALQTIEPPREMVVPPLREVVVYGFAHVESSYFVECGRPGTGSA